MNIFNKLFLLSFCFIFAGFHAFAQEQIAFTWTAGTAGKSFILRATGGKTYTINWGDASSSTATGMGGSAATHTHSYTPGNYTVTVIGETDCLFTYLDVKTSQVTALDVSNAPSLTDIVCNNNLLTNLDLSANSALVSLHCYHNALINLNVSNNPSLAFLVCNTNQLTTLDVTQNHGLLELQCFQNSLTSLDVSQNPLLAYLFCYGNRLTVLDISNNAQLSYLWCGDNLLSDLNVAANPFLSVINCINNKLSLSHLYAISSLKPNQQLGTQNLDTAQAYKNIETELTDVPVISGQPTVYEVRKGGLPAPASDYTIANGRITFHSMGTYTVKKTNTKIRSDPSTPAVVNRVYKVSGTRSVTFTWKGNTGKSFSIQATAGESFTVNWGDASAIGTYTGSGTTDITPTHSYPSTTDYTVTVTGSSMDCLFTVLNLNNKEVNNLDVINAIDLTEIRCRSNTLSTLDVSCNSVLKYLDCNANLLTTINIAQNTALEHLDCSANPLYSLNITANTQLTNLQCANNYLSNLDVSANILLDTLNCSNNALSGLDVSQNTQLTTLLCNNNLLANLDVSNNTQLLFLESNYNSLTNLDISNNPLLSSLNCAYNHLPALNIAAIPLQHVFCHSNAIPLANLYMISAVIADQNETLLGMQWLDTLLVVKGIGVPVDAVLNGTNTAFTVSINGVPATNGVEYTINYTTQRLTFNTAGTYTVKMTNSAIIDNPTPVPASVYRIYDVSDLQTITFDWTGGAGKTFAIRATAGASFIVNWGDTHVDTLVGGTGDVTPSHTYANNNIYTVTVSNNGAASSFTLLNVSNQQVSAIDVSNARELSTLECASNVLSNLNVAQNTLLTVLDCSNNPLAGLNVASNTNLQRLYCNNTGLTGLDVTLNTQLTDLRCAANLLTALNVSQNTQLDYLDCSGNLLTNLSVVTNTLLQTLNCENNQLIVLNSNTNTVLELLNCRQNRLTSLNTDYNTQLKKLYCGDNRLSSLNITNNILLEDLQCGNNAIPALNIASNALLSIVHCYNNAISLANVYTLSNAISSTSDKHLGTQRLDTVPLLRGVSTVVDAVLGGVNTVFLVNNGSALEGVDYTVDYITQTITFNIPGLYTVKMTNSAITSDTAYPAEVFRSYDVTGTAAISFVWQGGNNKSFNISATVGEPFTVDWGDGNIDSFTGNGIGMANAITPVHNYTNANTYTVTVSTNSINCQFAYLNVVGKQVNSMDLRYAVGLYQLDCSMNSSLGSLDVSHNADLAILYCITTSLTSLDVTNNARLRYLNCSSNALTALNLNNNPLLYSLNCEDNPALYNLNVSANLQLQELMCGNTSLTTLNVSANSLLRQLNCRDNSLTVLDLSNNAQLTTLNVNNNRLSALSIIGNPVLANLSCHNNHIPLANLFTLSEAIAVQSNKRLGTQRLDTLTVLQGAANPVDAVLSGINTLFVVNGGAATDGVEYTVNYAAQTIRFNVNGVFTVKMTNDTIKSDASLPAEVWRTYEVGSFDVANAAIGSLPSQVYTGYAFEPWPIVTMGLTTLVKDTDYTLSYSGNIDVGVATVTVTGRGSYHGTNYGTFTITPMVVTVSELSVQTKVYDGTTNAVILFDLAAFKLKLSPADTATLVVNAPVTGTFVQATEGVNIPVIVSGNVTLSGAKASNYIIIQQNGLTGTIVNNSTDATITRITNTTYNTIDNTYVVECGKNTATVYVHTNNPAALVIYNGIVAIGHQFDIDVSRPGMWTETFTVSTPDSSAQQSFTITFVKWFDIDLTDDACIIKEKWNNTLLVNNNPASNGNYEFTTYAWFKDNMPIGNEQSYSAGDAPTDRLDPNAYYYVMLDTRDGRSLRTCPFHPLVQLMPVSSPLANISVYPNPASAGQPVQVTTTIPVEQLRNAYIDVYSMTGRRMSTRQMSDNVTSITIPAETGIYVLKVRTAT
ncbi:MAG: YDG domain-containing protein, partial [Prevotellaceae bacterium]|nr:YDG domain-containing protein [Prevotellaceae bacterium]